MLPLIQDGARVGSERLCPDAARTQQTAHSAQRRRRRCGRTGLPSASFLGSPHAPEKEAPRSTTGCN